MTHASVDLRNEHDGILFGLDILEQMADSARKTGAHHTDDVREMIRFLRLFADKCHHGKEEGLFFPALEKAGVPSQGGPIGQMLLEHTEGRKHVAAMDAALRDGELDCIAFAAAAEDYATLLRAHIGKENKVLFPAGDRMLPAAQHQQLLRQFEAHEEAVMGKDTLSRLRGLLDALEQKYLK